MSTKEALQSLQSRLAERLQANQGNVQAGHWLGVRVGVNHFLLPLAQAGEIYPWSEPHPVSYTQDWFLGVANLRGALCGVVNLPLYLQLSPASILQATAAGAQLQDKRLVALHPAFELNVVLAVDQLLGLKNADQLSAAPNSHSLLDAQGTQWQPIDLAAIVQSPNFLSIAAP